jgi:hypothetical protein
MAQANTDTSTTSRRRFLTVAAVASAVSATALAAAAMPVHQACTASQDDSALVKLEELIFEQYEGASAYDAEIKRLAAIWTTESHRRYMESLDSEGNCPLGPQERWDLLTEMPACIEHNRLCSLQEVHIMKMEALVRQMWAIPALTPEGRRAKVLVALGCLLPDDWRQVDEQTDYGIREARQILIEFVGGEPAEQLRDQFSDGPKDWQNVGMV